MALGIVGSLLAIMIAWGTLGLPRPALIQEVANVEQFSVDTRILVLLEKKKQAYRELEILESRLLKDNGNVDLINKKVDLKLELSLIQGQLDLLYKK